MMATAAAAFTVLVALLHFLFMAGETIGWDQMARRFGFSKDEAETTRMLAINQGFYNGAVSCVLLWALFAGHPATVTAMLLFVIAMSVVGALTARWSIIIIQGAPAVVALALHLAAG